MDREPAAAEAAARNYRDEKRHWRRVHGASKGPRKQSLLVRLTAWPLRFVFHAAQLFLGALPIEDALQIGALGARLAYYLMGRRRRVALKNLELAFGDSKSPEELRRIARESFENFGRLFVEFIRFPRMSHETMLRRVTAVGRRHYDEADGPGLGSIAISAHLGNFELVAASGNHRLPAGNHLVGRKIKPPAVDAIVTGLRASQGVRTIASKNALRTMLKTLREHDNLGVVVDQNMRRGVGVFVNYFGVAASTTPSVALLAMKRPIAILPVFAFRVGRSPRHVQVFLPQVPLAKTGDRERDLLVNTQRYTHIVEVMVRRFPEQWFWFHQRWRSRPPAETGGPRAILELGEPEFLAAYEAHLDAVLAELPAHLRPRGAGRP